MPRVMLIDPLTLLGRELLAGLAASPLQPTVEYRHTGAEDEHQITELGGVAALVPALEDASELEGFDAVVVATDLEGPRLQHVATFLDLAPSTTVLVDAAATELLRDRTRPALPGTGIGDGGALRVAHPALLATFLVVSALERFEPLGGSLLALEPASARADGAIEQLARQAVARLQGQAPQELIDEYVLAFGMVPVDPLDLAEDAACLRPDLDLVVTKALIGLFHGHVASICVDLAQDATTSDVEEAFAETAGIATVAFGLGVERAMDSDRVLVAPPAVSRSERRVSITAMADGLRVTAATAWQLALPYLSIS